MTGGGGTTDGRLVLPAAGAWAAVALAWGQPAQGAIAVGCLVAGSLGVVLALVALAHRPRIRAGVTIAAVGAAFAGLLLSAVPPAVSLEGCDAMVVELGGHGTPAPVRVLEAECRDAAAADAVRGAGARAVLVELDGAPTAGFAAGDRLRLACDAWRGDGWLLACEEPELVERPWWTGWAGPMRDGLRTATAHLPGDGGDLLPGLAIGDTTQVQPALDAAMTTSGLSHLTAVSGANCAIVVALGLGIGTAVGLGRVGRVVTAGVMLAAFVVLVGAEPSVVRASIMAALALVALWRGVRRVGIALLALAVLVALGLDPSLARSAGFALSVLATAGLLLHAQPLTAALARRMPFPLAAALGVPLAAQLWCLPVLVVLDARLSLVAVPANVLAAPAAPLATMLGLVVCVVALLAPALASAIAWLAWLPSAWICAIAGASTTLPDGPAWPPGWPGVLLAVAVVGAVGIGVAAGRARRGAIAACCVVVVAIGTVQVPQLIARATLPDWSVAQCDVGQGAATVLRAGDAIALVDTGREPEPLEACLALLGIARIDVLVLTHFDADHVGGVDAVAGDVGLLVHGPQDEESPALLAALETQGATLHQGAAGERILLGDAALDLLWPAAPTGARAGVEPGNDASLVVSTTLGALDVVVLGDLGAEAQRALLADGVPEADVVVVAHHGSPDQHLPLYDELAPSLALVPVGENTYGHPAPELLDELERRGIAVLRTDRDGTVALDERTVWRGG